MILQIRHRIGFFCLISLFSCVCAFAGHYSGGTGEQLDPYLISTVDDWLELMNTSADWDEYFKLTNNLDMTGQTLTPVGIASTRFTGVFNGNGHTISNVEMIILDRDYLGLFGCTFYGDIKNLTLNNFYIEGETEFLIGTSYVGCLAGQIMYGKITNCHVQNSLVIASNVIGGLIGSVPLDATVKNCSADATIIGSKHIGGLIGLSGTNIENCFSSGQIFGDEWLGGLVSENWTPGIIKNCYSSSEVNGTGINYAAGLVGVNRGTIINSYACGPVAGCLYMGGLVADYTGGDGTVISSYWDKNTTGQNTSEGGSGRTTSQMKIKSNFYHWDFLWDSEDGTEDVWRMCPENDDYPRLAWQYVQKGDFKCPDGVENIDFSYLAQQWLLMDISADVQPAEVDHIVNYRDWADFAFAHNRWLNYPGVNPDCDIVKKDYSNSIILLDDIVAFIRQWNQRGGIYLTDIAPTNVGDGVVNIHEVIKLSENWLDNSLP